MTGPLDVPRSLVVVLARGTDGTGLEDLLRPAALDIRSRIGIPVDIIELDYPATAAVVNQDWPGWVRLGHSPTIGVRHLVALLNDQAAALPSTGIVLLGFSQGALVITDTLTEPRRRHWGLNAPALTDRALRAIRVAVSVGNSSFRAGEPFNAGRPAPGVSGMHARLPGVLDHVAGKLVDIAEPDDIAAQHVRTSSMEGHLGYAERGYVSIISDIVVSRFRSR